MSTVEEGETISLPSLAFVAILGFIIYRYIISPRLSSSSTSSTSISSSHHQRSTGQRFTPAQVEQVSQMFPQLSRRDIMWDLQRNGGSVSATTERILGGHGLIPAPPSFQPQIAIPSPQPSSSSSGQSSKPVVLEQDLISRYNLQSKINANAKGKERAEEEVPATGWASSKEQRALMLRRRREEMILAARRRMQEREGEKEGKKEGEGTL